MKAGVVSFPGSNCDDDCLHALEVSKLFSPKRLWHKSTTDLSDFDLIILPGGFSYGDYLRTGAIASVSPIMEKVKDFAAQGGRVLGICNGFQILCESGLLPGALVRNKTLRFICKEVTLKEEATQKELKLPIAHGEGRFVSDSKTHEEMLRNGQVWLRYQEDINGSLDRIAGVKNKVGNVFGMMPHPERATDLGSRDGMKVWQMLAESLSGAQ